MTYKLQELIDMEPFQNMQDRLNEIYSFPSAIIDNDGNILTATAWQDLCTQFHRKNKECEQECIKSDQYIMSHLHEANPAVSYRCPHGLVDNATPIIIDGFHYGNFFTGQFFLEKPDLEFFRGQAKKYGFDEQAYLEAVGKVPIWTQEQLNSYLFFIKGLIAIISESGLKNLRAVEARQQIEESEKRYRALFTGASEGIFILSTDGKLLEVNESFATMHGYSVQEMLFMDLKDLDTPETNRLAPERIQRILAGETLTFEVEHYHKDGHIFSLEVSASLISSGGKLSIQCFHRDITDRKLAEEEKAKLEAQLQQSRKMDSVGRLAGGVAHDFNNMLGVILGHTEMAMEQVDPAQPLCADLQEIHKAASRSADLTRQLLAFARKQVVSPQVLDLNKTMTGMLTMLQRLIGEDIHLSWLPAVNLYPIKVDPSQMDQLLANLCINARDAINGVGKLTVETHNICFDENYCTDHVGFVPGEFVLLVVSDDGCGMDKETVDKIFEPFFTTKRMGQGTGLGLATVYGIVKQNNGFINVYSEPKQGTTFRVYLPRYSGDAEMTQPEKLPDPILHGQETILLVEDEPALLELNKLMLEAQGYHVLTASTPGEALLLAEEQAKNIQLLMTDVVMPEMNGREMAQKMLALAPGLKCLFTSGYTANVIAHHGVLDEKVQFIQKPFSRKDLAAKVREVLDQQ